MLVYVDNENIRMCSRENHFDVFLKTISLIFKANYDLFLEFP